jgi:hypothetical protein
VDDVEDLALGILSGERAARAREHLASCASCRVEHDRMSVECSLFAARAKVFPPPPALPAAVSFVPESSAEEQERGRFARATRGLVAALACAAALAGVAKLDRSTMVVDPVSLESGEAPSQQAAMTIDEPLSCALPASGVTSARTGDDALACVATSSRLCCEERVTSSVARP